MKHRWGRTDAGAFTLLELLLVIAVISILSGLLLPALGGTRHAAQSAACLSMQRQLALGLATYATASEEWIPGVNTSGRSLWRNPTEAQLAALSKYAHAPVQVNDWISPALGVGGGSNLPINRHARLYEILERYACPSMNERIPVWIRGDGDGGYGSDPGGRDFSDWLEDTGKPAAHAVSYLMPANFQLFGGRPKPGSPLIVQGSSTRLSLLARIHELPDDYQPRITRLGAPSRKIACADGFRYLDNTRVDFDASYSHLNWGTFTDRSACDVDCRSWGRNGGGGTGWNIPMSYRHQSCMNAAFWDGHAQKLTITESRNPILWAPTRSKVNHAMTYEADAKTYGYDPADPLRNRIE